MSMYPPVHISAITANQRCPRSHYYSDPSWGLGYRPRTDNERILLGNWFHYHQRLVNLEMLDYKTAYRNTINRQVELWETWGVPADHAAELQILFFNLTQAHELWQHNDKSHYADKNLEWVFVEEKFSVPYAGYLFEGQWDGIVRHKNTGELYVFERKTTKRPNEIELGIQWDWQPIGYTWAAEQIMNEPVQGVIYEIVKNTDPSQVKMLKSGLPSKAKDELDSTTFEVYLKELKDAALDKSWSSAEVAKTMADYQVQLDYLKVQPNPVFRRLPVPVSPGDLLDWPRQLIRKAEGLVQNLNLGDDVPYNLDRYNCYNFCPFRDVCLAQRDGMDWKELLTLEFVGRGKERL